MKKRFTEEQIVRILHEAEGGMSTRDLCRKHNVSEQSFYRWKAKYGGIGVSEVKRLRENTELKQIVAEQALDIAVDAVHRDVVRLSERYDYWGYRKIHDLLKGDIAIGRDSRT